MYRSADKWHKIDAASPSADRVRREYSLASIRQADLVLP